jgi:hypothetical protein
MSEAEALAKLREAAVERVNARSQRERCEREADKANTAVTHAREAEEAAAHRAREAYAAWCDVLAGDQPPTILA